MAKESKIANPVKGLGTDFSIALDERDNEQFLKLLGDEGLMRTGFAANMVTRA